MDRTKEPGSAGEPFYQDCVTAMVEGDRGIKVLGGRYGLASKEFTPAMVKAVFDNMAAATPKNHFTAGIEDDVTGTSLPFDPSFSVEGADVAALLFMASALTALWAPTTTRSASSAGRRRITLQGYFYYDSKKSGTLTTSHLRIGSGIRSAPAVLDRLGELHSLPSVGFPRALRHACQCRYGRDLPAQ